MSEEWRILIGGLLAMEIVIIIGMIEIMLIQAEVI
jgi:hypothetical protein